jgi:excisionase family DNA binding protein
MTPDKQWITVAEAAAKTGYSVRVLQRLLQQRKIEGRKPGRDWFTTLEAVEAYRKTVKRGRPRKDDRDF